MSSNIKSIQLNGLIDYDYLVVNDSIIGTFDEEGNNTILSYQDDITYEQGQLYNQNYVPSWSDTFLSLPVLICNFNNTIDSENKTGLTNKITNYILYRKEYIINLNGEEEEISYKKIADVDTIDYENKIINGIIDYTVSNNKLYKWYLVPFIEENNILKSLGAQEIKLNDSLKLYSNDYTNIYFLKERESKSFGVKDIFSFRANVIPTSLTHNIDKVQFDNYTQYPKFSISSKNYFSGSISCLLGDIVYRENENVILKEYRMNNNIPYINYYEPLNLWKKWCDNIASGDKVLIKDRKGDIFLAQIISNASSSLGNMDDLPRNINFNFVECDDYRNYQIYDIQFKSNEVE